MFDIVIVIVMLSLMVPLPPPLLLLRHKQGQSKFKCSAAKGSERKRPSTIVDDGSTNGTKNRTKTKMYHLRKMCTNFLYV